jgi:Protein kinase domain
MFQDYLNQASTINNHLEPIKMARNLSHELDHLKLKVKVSHDLVEETEYVTVRSGEKKVPVVKIWDIQNDGFLGHGVYGEVRLHVLRGQTEQKRAVKRVLTQNFTEEERQMELKALILFTKRKVCMHELAYGSHHSTQLELKDVQYRDADVFIDFYGWYSWEGATFLVMEHAPLRDLEHHCNQKGFKGLPEEEVQDIVRQILSGLAIMHSELFAHRDLKPAVRVQSPKNIWLLANYCEEHTRHESFTFLVD